MAPSSSSGTQGKLTRRAGYGSVRFASGFSEGKLKFAIGKVHAQFFGRRHLGRVGYKVLGKPFELLSDLAFEAMH